jgi:hypothetical protein
VSFELKSSKSGVREVPGLARGSLLRYRQQHPTQHALFDGVEWIVNVGRSTCPVECLNKCRCNFQRLVGYFRTAVRESTNCIYIPRTLDA